VVDNPTALCYNYYISKETNKQLRKRNKMKNVIIASVVASIAAGSAMARGELPLLPATAPVTAEFGTESVIWEGTASGLPDGCVFTKNVDGKMSYAENTADSGGVWTVTQKAVLEVSVRGKETSLTVEADSDIKRVGGVDTDQTSAGHLAYAVTVDYAAGPMPTVVDRSHRYFDTAGDLVDERQTMVPEYSAGKLSLLKYNVGKHNKIELGGKATMNYSGALIDNGEYELGHTATCLQ
jgi:hypothetical protein